MKLSTKIIISIVVASLVVVAFGVLLQKSGTSLGSVGVGNEYNATTTTSVMANTHSVVSANSPITLGSVVVASSSVTTFTIWNATSTTDVASTTFATFDVGVAEGTYTFDTVLDRGLIIAASASFDGVYITTWRR